MPKGCLTVAISLALMFNLDLDALSLYSLRGDAYRPGIRGLAVDRIFLAEVAKTILVSRANSSLLSTLMVSFHPQSLFTGYGEAAFPLESLLPEDNKRKAEGILGSSPIYQRLRVAARWHAKVIGVFDTADAVLALGISFDALLSEEGNRTPGRAIAEYLPCSILTPKFDIDGTGHSRPSITQLEVRWPMVPRSQR